MKTKKFFALLLALVMMLSMGTVAFAAEGDTPYLDETTVDIPKIYSLANKYTTNPAETFEFTITPYAVTDSQATVANMPKFDKETFTIGYNEGEATLEGDKNTTTLTLPTFEYVGIYTYEIKETAGTTAGVEYTEKPIYLKITVIEQDGLKRVVAMHYETEDGKKIEDNDTLGFGNTYSAAEKIAITKKVTGNMGDKSKYFDVKVEVTNPADKTAPATYKVTGGSNTENPTTITAGAETTFKIKDGETINIENVPYGVTYTVVESDYTVDGYDAAAYSGTDITSAGSTGSVDSAAETVEITNNKSSKVDTGIMLDNLPYVLMLCIVAAGAAVLFLKKRFAMK